MSEGKTYTHEWTDTVVLDDPSSETTVRLRCTEQYQGYIYESSDDIVAGETIGEKEFHIGSDLDTDTTTDTYPDEIQSEVDFRCGANSTIYLKPGFTVDYGEGFSAKPQ